MLSKYKSGFTVSGKHPIEEVEWLFNEEESTEIKLLFQAYDAALYPLLNLSGWKNGDWENKNIQAGLERTKDFTGEVWLDDVKIK